MYLSDVVEYHLWMKVCNLSTAISYSFSIDTVLISKEMLSIVSYRNSIACIAHH